MFQAGYLTITDYDDKRKQYTLDFPNEEVEVGFKQNLAPIYIKLKNQTVFDYNAFVDDMLDCKLDQFMKRLQALFANLDYEIMGGKESDFHNTLQVIFFLLSASMRVERHTSDGRMDVEIETDDYVAIFELKIDKSADVALKQIEDKNYAGAFAISGKKIYKIGVNFSTKTRGLEEYKIVS